MASEICFIQVLNIDSSLEGTKRTDKRLPELCSLWREGIEAAALCLDNSGRTQPSKKVFYSQSKVREMVGRGSGAEGAIVVAKSKA